MESDLPTISLRLLEDLTERDEGGFLRLLRHRYRAHYADGSESPPFLYDQIERSALDAVVLVVHFVDAHDRPCVYLRSAVRPPLLSRLSKRLAEPERHPKGQLWELPAGLVEAHEATPEGLYACARRELEEEVGFCLGADRFTPLGPSALSCPGVLPERLHFFSVAVDPAERSEPSLDGSPLEHAGVVRAVELDTALAFTQSGALDDMKTELGLRRLKERLLKERPLEERPLKEWPRKERPRKERPRKERLA